PQRRLRNAPTRDGRQCAPSRSTTNTSVSFPLIPNRGRPFDPYPSVGGTTSRTRLPTCFPTNPRSMPIIHYHIPTDSAAGRPSNHYELNTFPSRQKYPAYCNATSWSFFTGGPSPRTSVRTCRPFGAALRGTSTRGTCPAPASATLGSAGSSSGACRSPRGPADLPYTARTSSTYTSVSSPSTRCFGSPFSPKPSSGGIRATTRDPGRAPASAFASPGTTCPVGNAPGLPCA